MKILKFLLLVFASLYFTGCSWFNKPADVEIIGIGLVFDDDGVLVAYVDSTRYTPSYIYTTLDGKTKIYPDQTLTVTAFKIIGSPDVEFIAGGFDEEFLEEYFKENHIWDAVFMVLCIAALIAVFVAIFVFATPKWYITQIKKKE